MNKSGALLRLVLLASSVAMFAEIQLLSPESVTVDPGKRFTVLISLSNTGMEIREFPQEIKLPPEWKIITRENVVRINPGESRITLVSIFVPATTPASTYPVTLSFLDDETVTEHVVSVEVSGLPDYRLELIKSPDFLLADDDAQLEYLLTNTGNTPLVLRYTLTVDKSLTIAEGAPHDEYTLLPLETASLPFILTVFGEPANIERQNVKLTVEGEELPRQRLDFNVSVIPRTSTAVSRFVEYPLEINTGIEYSDESYRLASVDLMLTGSGSLNEADTLHLELDSALHADTQQESITFDPRHDYLSAILAGEDLYAGAGRLSVIQPSLIGKTLTGDGLEGAVTLSNTTIQSYYLRNWYQTIVEQQQVTLPADNFGLNYRFSIPDHSSGDLILDTGIYAFVKKNETRTVSILAEKTTMTPTSWFEFVHQIAVSDLLTNPGAGIRLENTIDRGYLSLTTEWHVNTEGFYESNAPAAGFSQNAILRLFDKSLFLYSGFMNEREGREDRETRGKLGINYKIPRIDSSVSFFWYHTIEDKSIYTDKNQTENLFEYKLTHPFTARLRFSLDGSSDFTNSANSGDRTVVIKQDLALSYNLPEAMIITFDIQYEENRLNRAVLARRLYAETGAQFTTPLGLLGLSYVMDTDFPVSGGTPLSDHIIALSADFPVTETRNLQFSLSMGSFADNGITPKSLKAELRLSDVFNIPIAAKRNISSLKGSVLHAGDGAPYADVVLKIGRNSAVTNAEGRFVFPALEPGDHYLIIDQTTIPGDIVLNIPNPMKLFLSPKQDAGLDITAQKASRIFGYINRFEFQEEGLLTRMQNPETRTYIAGEALGGILVEATDGKTVYRQSTDRFGFFEFPLLTAGTWTLRIPNAENASDYAWDTVEAEVVVEEDTENRFDFRFLREERAIRFLEETIELRTER